MSTHPQTSTPTSSPQTAASHAPHYPHPTWPRPHTPLYLASPPVPPSLSAAPRRSLRRSLGRVCAESATPEAESARSLRRTLRGCTTLKRNLVTAATANGTWSLPQIWSPTKSNMDFALATFRGRATFAQTPKPPNRTTLVPGLPMSYIPTAMRRRHRHRHRHRHRWHGSTSGRVCVF